MNPCKFSFGLLALFFLILSGQNILLGLKGDFFNPRSSSLKNHTENLYSKSTDSIPKDTIAVDTIDLTSSKKIEIDRDSTANRETTHLTVNQSSRIFFNNSLYYVYLLDYEKDEIKFYWKNKKTNQPLKSLSNLKYLVEENEDEILVFASNAGMYLSDNSPQGLFIQDGEILVPIDRKKKEYGNFYMQPNGVFVIFKDKKGGIILTDDFQENKIEYINFATQSGPMLLISGQINSNFKMGSNNLNIRNGVGITEDGRVVFVISDNPVNLYDFASFFRDELCCVNALYLDGAISKTYLPDLNRLQLGGNFGPMIGISKKVKQ